MLDLVVSSTAIFASADIEAALAYYKDVLGFESSWTWGDPPTFGSAAMGGVTIMFKTLEVWSSGVITVAVVTALACAVIGIVSPRGEETAPLSIP